VPQVQVSFDIDANGLLQVSATDRTTGRQQSVTIQGGSNLSEEEITQLLQEAEQKATEDRRKRAEVDRSNRAQTLVAQAERRLRDASLELGPYGAERQQRAVEMAVREVQDLLALNSKAENDLADLDMAVSQLQEALFGLNRRLMTERRSEQGPLQGLKNTLGSLKDELFADDDWDDWNRPGNDPWSTPPPRFGGESDRRNSYERNSFDKARYDRTPARDRASQGWGEPALNQWGEPAPDQWGEPAPPTPYRDDDPWGDR
jgi:molecular chaperone DnaK